MPSVRPDAISIVVPARNEEGTIKAVLDGLRDRTDDLIVVDGHSEDRTVAIANACGARVVQDHGRGKGDAVRVGLTEARHAITVFIDADGSHDPNDIPRLIDPIAAGKADLVIGSRMLGGSEELFGSLSEVIRLIGSLVISLSINYRFGLRLTDYQNGFRAIRTEVGRRIGLTSDLTTIEQEMAMRCLRYGYRVAESPAHEARRQAGMSKINVMRVAHRYVWNLVRGICVARRPSRLPASVSPAGSDIPDASRPAGTPAPHRSGWDWAAAAACVAALGVALTLAHAHRVPQLGVEQDFIADYQRQAQNLLHGRPYTYRHSPPGYSLLVAVVSLLTPDLFTAGKLIGVAATALLGWCTYALLKSLFDGRTAFCATALVLLAVLPFGYLAATDVVAAMMMTLSVWLLLRQSAPDHAACLLAGLGAGAAYLIRSNAIFLLPGLGIAILLARRRSDSDGGHVGRLAWFAGGFLVVTLPWFVANQHMNGSPFGSTAYLQIAAHFYEPQGDSHATSLILAADRFHSLGEALGNDPVRVANRYLRDVLLRNPEALAVQGIGFPGYLFAGAGVLVLLGELNDRRRSYALLLVLGYLLLGLVGFYLRYYLFVFPLLFLCVVRALFGNSALTRGRGLLGHVVPWLAFGCIAVSVARASTGRIEWDLAHEPRYLVPIADSLRHRSVPGNILIEFRPYLAYLAGLRDTFPLAQSAVDFLARARAMHARYLVYTAEEESIWPPLASLRDPSTVPDGLRLLYRYDPVRLLVYEVALPK
jgi:glycosyl transferase family 2/dolichyl-phosphate-mannose-protein mannosyltransferase